MRKLTTEEFIEKAISVHGDRYDYSLVEYVNARTKVKIICKEHGVFEQNAGLHINNKNGCSSCNGGITLTTKEFITKAKQIHNDKYRYDNSIYVNGDTKLDIFCPIHGNFKQTPHNHFKNAGCSKCSGKYQPTTEEFITKAIAKHGNRYDYSKSEYSACEKKIKIICKEHGVFEQTPSNHISRDGCSKCSGKYQPTTEEFITKAIAKHGNRYDYSKSDYSKALQKIIIICKLHGIFEQTPANHLFGQGCPKCSHSGYSKLALEWLNFISKEKDIYIQHAMNKGEYKIPNTKYKVDGFCKDTNTVYEFHGDRWHGNPQIYKETDRPHPFNEKLAKDLYNATIEREEHIIHLGYNLISIWESEYTKIYKYYDEL